MINAKLKEILKDNWGERAESLNCYAEVKFFDEKSRWACYVYAMNPQDENEIACIIDNGGELEETTWFLSEMLQCYNDLGEHPTIDKEYRKIKASHLFKILRRGL